MCVLRMLPSAGGTASPCGCSGPCSLGSNLEAKVLGSLPPLPPVTSELQRAGRAGRLQGGARPEGLRRQA